MLMRKFLYAVIALAVGFNVFANEYFNASGVPSTGAALNSATMRGEFSSIGAGFDKLPTMTGNGNKVVTVNSGGTALTATAATALSGMAIGTNVQAWDADLDALSALSSTAGMLARTGAGTFAVRTLTGTANEVTVANGDGSGTPTLSLPNALTFTGKTVTGGTFATPALTGTPTAPTASVGTSTTQIATTAFVMAAHAPITNSLSGDVALSIQSTYYTGPSIAQGSSGTWFVTGTVSITDGAGSSNIDAKLWDGTTVIASARGTVPGANGTAVITLSGYLASPAGNIRISVSNVTTASGVMVYNSSGNGKDSTISAIRIQ